MFLFFRQCFFNVKVDIYSRPVHHMTLTMWQYTRNRKLKRDPPKISKEVFTHIHTLLLCLQISRKNRKTSRGRDEFRRLLDLKVFRLTFEHAITVNLPLSRDDERAEANSFAPVSADTELTEFAACRWRTNTSKHCIFSNTVRTSVL